MNKIPYTVGLSVNKDFKVLERFFTYNALKILINIITIFSLALNFIGLILLF